MNKLRDIFTRFIKWIISSSTWNKIRDLFLRFVKWALGQTAWDVLKSIVLFGFSLYQINGDFLGLIKIMNVIVVIFVYYLFLLGLWSFINNIVGELYKFIKHNDINSDRKTWIIYIFYFVIIVIIFMYQTNLLNPVIDRIRDVFNHPTQAPVETLTITRTPTSTLTTTPTSTSTVTVVPTLTLTPWPNNKFELVDDFYQCINRFTETTMKDNCWEYLSDDGKRDMIDEYKVKDKYLQHNIALRYRYVLYDCFDNGKGQYYVGMKYAIYPKDDPFYTGSPIQTESFMMIYIVFEKQNWKYWFGSKSTSMDIEGYCEYVLEYDRW